MLVTYNGQVCFTPYFASASTGKPRLCRVWGGERAWLQAVDSPYDQQVFQQLEHQRNSSGTARFSREDAGETAIRDELGIDLAGVDPNSWFTIKSANSTAGSPRFRSGPDSNSETVMAAGSGKTCCPPECGWPQPAQPVFTVSYDADLDCFIFDVYGYGHGCGMSQWGAIGYARNGWSYQDILTHYFRWDDDYDVY